MTHLNFGKSWSTIWGPVHGSIYAKTTYAPAGPMEPADASLVGNIGGYTAFGLQMQNLPDTEHFYMGRKWDDETQTYYFRHRNYSPQYGRFTTRDPYVNGG